MSERWTISVCPQCGDYDHHGPILVDDTHSGGFHCAKCDADTGERLIRVVPAFRLAEAEEALRQIDKLGEVSDPIHREYPLVQELRSIARFALRPEGTEE